jgi:hypothetical protein
MIIPIFRKTLAFRRFMRSVRCAGQSAGFAQDRYYTAFSKAHRAFGCAPKGPQPTKRF